MEFVFVVDGVDPMHGLSRQTHPWQDLTMTLTANGMRAGSGTSNTWNPAQDREFGTETDPSNTGSAASASQVVSSTHWRPQLRKQAMLGTHLKKAQLVNW